MFPRIICALDVLSRAVPLLVKEEREQNAGDKSVGEYHLRGELSMEVFREHFAEFAVGFLRGYPFTGILPGDAPVEFATISAVPASRGGIPSTMVTNNHNLHRHLFTASAFRVTLIHNNEVYIIFITKGLKIQNLL